MPELEDRPTIAERYAVAMESSNLKMRRQEMGTGDADIIMAAGLAKGHRGQDLGFATSLYRLRCEFDSVKAVMRLGKALTLTDRLLVLMELKTLASVKRELGARAVVLATRKRFMKPDEDALRVAGRALDVWLSPVCPKCEGTGTRSEEGKPAKICRSCGGSGHRKNTVGLDDAEHAFGKAMLVYMDEHVAMVDEGMRRQLGHYIRGM